MAKKIIVGGKRPKKGVKMTKGQGWKLIATKGKQRDFNASLLGTVNRGKLRLAIFSVPKKFFSAGDSAE